MGNAQRCEGLQGIAASVAENPQPVVVAVRLSYKGAAFCGFARQPGQLTVQGSLEEALGLLYRRPVETVCAGRTDSGVHALSQWVSFELSEDEWAARTPEKLRRSLDALTHDDVAIRQVERKEPAFSARFSAVSREYRYFITTGAAAPLLLRDFSWHVGKGLDVDAMRAGTAFLIGEHDFKSFCMAASAEGKTTWRNVARIDVKRTSVWGDEAVVITVVGNAFLHSMVRTIVGTLVAVGLGRRKPEWVSEVLAARNRSAAGENAPAQGLVFWRVNYDGPRLFDPQKQDRSPAHEML